jgi:hypothetical protein
MPLNKLFIFKLLQNFMASSGSASMGDRLRFNNLAGAKTALAGHRLL